MMFEEGPFWGKHIVGLHVLQENMPLGCLADDAHPSSGVPYATLGRVFLRVIFHRELPVL